MQKKRNCVTAGMMVIMLAVTGCGSARKTDKDIDIEKEGVIIPVEESREMDSTVQNQSDERQHDVTQQDVLESANADDVTDSIDDDTAAGYDKAITESNENNGRNDTIENIGGKVKSISQDSFVLSRVIVDENGMILVMPGEGGPNELLTTVHCTDSTVYEHWTIQGGGAGIEKKEAAFSDITEGSDLEAEGYFEGEEFIADKVIIEVYQ
ncbi:MAG: hypothetical protein NC231_04095 [Bacillus sp. (in: Bacteria)]|nr:hypothetical protein [Bacillus sp. (in: firmicutes)]MCM1425868.1 hypothetical protein [Eubacterium sp.]